MKRAYAGWYEERPREYTADSKYLKLPVLYNYIGSLFFEGQL
jgi:hypothetical protein